MIEALHDAEAPVATAAAAALIHIAAPGSVALLTTALHDSREQVQREAARVLVALGPMSIPAVIGLLDQQQPAVRQRAVGVLSQIGEAAVEPLVATLSHSNAEAREAAIAALVQIGTPAVGALTEALEHEQALTREGAVLALERLHWQPQANRAGAAYALMKEDWATCVACGADAMPPLISAFRRGSEEDRKHLFGVALHIGVPALPSLVTLLEHDSEALRQFGCWTLIKIGAPAIAPVNTLMHREETKLRQTAIFVLRHIQHPQAVDALIEGLKDKEPAVRRACADALQHFGQAVVPQLITAMSHENGEIRWESALVLERMGWRPKPDEVGARFLIVKGDWRHCVQIGAPAVAPLISYLHHWDPNMRQSAAWALGEIGKPSIDPLIATLKEGETVVRMLAAEVLGHIGDERAVPPLTALLSDADKEVGDSAYKALTAIDMANVRR
ncbi:MAG: HEAT repeat domain-containing protein [Chloroflexaceae bacterium]|nr:HEAT repeat domain-containing protein [Chloroflexaceae bacterium]